jgi:hypothetical protein
MCLVTIAADVEYARGTERRRMANEDVLSPKSLSDPSNRNQRKRTA